MHSLNDYLADCSAQGLLVPSPIGGVFWSRDLSNRLATAAEAGVPEVRLGLGDFLVGSYATLKAKRRAIQDLHPGSWRGTEIHHVVENFHLQFLGQAEPLGDRTYEHREPCVLLAKKHHDTHINAIVADAEALVMETKPFDFVEAFRREHPGISRKSRTEQGRLRSAWVATQEKLAHPPVRRPEIRQTLLEIYSFAYQTAELKPLRLIAKRVISVT